jgi:hypothetical protein
MSIDSIYSSFDIDERLLKFLAKVQPSAKGDNTKEFDNLVAFLQSNSGLQLSDTQIDYLLQGNEQRALIGICHISGSTLTTQLTKLSKYALHFIHFLLFEFSTINK